MRTKLWKPAGDRACQQENYRAHPPAGFRVARRPNMALTSFQSANLKLISRARFTWENRAQYGMQAFTCNGARSAIQWSSKDMGLEKFQEWTLVEFLPRGRCSAVMELLYLSASPATV